MEIEWRSKLEELMPAEELLFDPTPAFGKYRMFLEHAIAHPAKANTNLLEFLIKRYTKEGDVILDPMAGTGSTGVVAALNGRNAIQVEIEPRFFEWMEKAREKVEKCATFAKKGWIKNICGDARRLSELLKQVDAIITSPPYAETISKHAGGKCRLVRVGISTITARQYSESENNIGNLPLGSIDAIITSPPYAEANRGGGIAVKGYDGKYGKDEKLPLRHDRPLSDDPSNISNLPFGSIDAVIAGQPARRETYLEAMLKVYREMFKVLKPGGKAIVIVKPFIRNRQVVDLPYYTFLLMRKAGFELVKLYKLRLKRQSFWRIMYYKKHPEVPRISHEYVLVCEKP